MSGNRATSVVYNPATLALWAAIGFGHSELELPEICATHLEIPTYAWRNWIDGIDGIPNCLIALLHPQARWSNCSDPWRDGRDRHMDIFPVVGGNLLQACWRSQTVGGFTTPVGLGLKVPLESWYSRAGFVSVLGPMQQEAVKSARFLAAQGDPAAFASPTHREQGTSWVLLAVATANVILGVWRPRLGSAPAVVASRASG